jgi:hypothetical protein
MFTVCHKEEAELLPPQLEETRLAMVSVPESVFFKQKT